MIDAAWAQNFAQEWVEAWNSHDLERIYALFTDDFEMTSPLISKRGYDASGTLHGKDAVRPYWQAGLDAVPPLRFELVNVLIGENSITINFRHASGKLAAEVLIFNEHGLVMKGIAHHQP